MANVLVEETSLQNIANSIREKTGTTDTYKPSEMASAISGIQSGGISVPEKGVVINEYDSDGYPTDVSLVGYTIAPAYLFYSFSSSYFSKMLKIDLPNELTMIDARVFDGCSSLLSINLPSGVTKILDNAFQGCIRMTTINLPENLSIIDVEAFYNSGLTSITIPSGVTIINRSVFGRCRSLTEAILQGDVTKISGYEYGSSFHDCSALTKVVLANVTSVPTMVDGSYTFKNTPIASGTGYIYVPDTLVDSFKSATNWSKYANQIKPISEMPTE